MSDKHNTDFDLQMKALLEDAEIKPSPRVWKAVSSRLAVAEQGSAAASWAWMKWAGIGLAAAAAISAGIFFSGTQQMGGADSQIQIVSSAVARAEQPIPTYSNTNKQDVLMADAGEVVRPNVHREAVSTHTVSPVDQTGNEPVAEAPALQEPVHTPIQPQESTIPEQSPIVEDDGMVTFEEMERLSTTRERRHAPQLYLNGSVIGNDSDFRSIRKMDLMAPPSLIEPETGVTELGDSSYGIPLTIGIGIRHYIAPRLSVGTGLNYSLLTRSFEGKYTEVENGIVSFTEKGTISHSMHYVGIPLNIYYDIASAERFRFYIFGGGQAEYCVSNQYSLLSKPMTYNTSVKGIQWSVAAGLGVQFNVSRRIGIYVDPGANWYFKSSHPSNVRSEHPLLVNFDAGIRLDF